MVYQVTKLTPLAIRKQLTALNFNADKIKIITVSLMDEAALKNCTSKENEGFYNSYMNVVYRRGERYVLGYRCEDPLIEHAIIKIGDLYFDPTEQANGEFVPYQFAVLTEFKIFDMMKHAKTNKEFPPDVDYLLSKEKHFKNIINSEK